MHSLSDFSELRDRVGRLEDKLEQNTDSTNRIEVGVGQLVELMHFASSGIGFFAGVGRALRRFVVWVTPFLTLLGVMWAIFHGKWPDRP